MHQALCQACVVEQLDAVGQGTTTPLRGGGWYSRESGNTISIKSNNLYQIPYDTFPYSLLNISKSVAGAWVEDDSLGSHSLQRDRLCGSL